MPLRTIVLAMLLLLAGRAGAETPAWADVETPERRLVTRLLESPHWPMRAFALLRLERYDGETPEALVRARLGDEAWQTRCFALHAARRRRIAVTAADLEGERDGRVIRTALRHGIALDAERVERGARRLLRSRDLDDLLLGLELAAASDIAPLRTEARDRLTRGWPAFDEFYALYLELCR